MVKSYNKGSYLLLIYLDKNVEINVGSLGVRKFERGFYVYVGSALNSLTDRVKRHLKVEKKKHWHIDYLLEHSKIILSILIPSEERLECYLAKKFNGKVIVEGFGSTDCKCKSHLFYYSNLNNALDEIFNVLKCLLKEKLEI